MPLAQSVTLHAALPQGELVILPGADHLFSRPVDRAAYQAAIQGFLVRHL